MERRRERKPGYKEIEHFCEVQLKGSASIILFYEAGHD